MKKLLLGLGFLAVFAVPVLRSQDQHADDEHVVVKPDAIKWGSAPKSLPPGAKAAILVGDPGKSGASYVIRVQFPDGYKVPPHWHSTDENVTVLKGALLVGKGEKMDVDKMLEMPAGSYMRMPKTMRHYAMAKGDTILQVHGVGPFDVNYVNAADDPRKKAE